MAGTQEKLTEKKCILPNKLCVTCIGSVVSWMCLMEYLNQKIIFVNTWYFALNGDLILGQEVQEI